MTVCEKNLCTGCMACIDICPQKAISIVDDYDTYNAVINTDKCVHCNLCYTHCQNNNKPIFRKPVIWKQGWAKDDRTRLNSSSGGVAAVLELTFINIGGIIYSCTLTDSGFRYVRTNRLESVAKYSGSKYVKSNPEGVYKEVKKDLLNGYKVLFVGLPCHVAAVINYCENAENLYTVDLICHGTPSPKILELFLADYGIGLEDLYSLSFRIKNSFSIIPNDRMLFHPRITDYYTLLFMNSTTYTENCYSCIYAKIERVSDITIGDSWGSQLSDEEKSKGISLVLVQTEKGQQLITDSKLILKDVDLDVAIDNNHQLKNPSYKNEKREKFFALIKDGKTYNKAFAKCFPKQYVKDNVKKVLIMLNILK